MSRTSCPTGPKYQVAKVKDCRRSVTRLATPDTSIARNRFRVGIPQSPRSPIGYFCTKRRASTLFCLLLRNGLGKCSKGQNIAGSIGLTVKNAASRTSAVEYTRTGPAQKTFISRTIFLSAGTDPVHWWAGSEHLEKPSGLSKQDAF
jgi:hypothetical protein